MQLQFFLMLIAGIIIFFQLKPIHWVVVLNDSPIGKGKDMKWRERIKYIMGYKIKTNKLSNKIEKF
jgi:hypothetical protein